MDGAKDDAPARRPTSRSVDRRPDGAMVVAVATRVRKLEVEMRVASCE